MIEETNTPEETFITEEELTKAIELFNEAYPYLLDEIDRVEAERGKLNEFQLMLAVARAKDRLIILGWNCRKTVNAIFGTFVDLYQHSGKGEAEDWAEETLGSNRLHILKLNEDYNKVQTITNPKIVELELAIKAKEAELFLLQQELLKVKNSGKTEEDLTEQE